MTEQLLSNRYRIIRELSEGGFGKTFLAEDTHMPAQRRCVVKQLKPVTANPQIYQLVQERFQREAAILEDLGDASDQIPRLYAYFASAGEFYLVQEWIDGETLTEKVQQHGTLNESAVRDILVSLLPVLDYVHSKRIVHRDIKPDNIIVRHRDGKPVLIDFGAVRETMATVVTTGGNAASSIVIGTPGFMPSEQAAGRPVYSSDLYSLALTAIYLLSGKVPQELATDPHSGEIIWQRQVLNVSPSLAAVLDKAIQSHLRDRYPTARAMLEALQPPVAAPIPPTMPSPQPHPQPMSTPQPPANAGNGQKAVIMGSIITGSLVGACAVVALILTKPTQETTPQTPISQTDPTPSTTPQPIPVNSTPPDNRLREEISRPSPEEAVREQYSNINSRQYAAAWERLSPRLQNDTGVFPAGYTDYVNWWETVDFVDLQQIALVERSSETSTVKVKLKYLIKNKKVSPESRRLSLVWDNETGRWLIDKIK